MPFVRDLSNRAEEVLCGEQVKILGRVMPQDQYLLKDFESGHQLADENLHYPSRPVKPDPFVCRSSKPEKLVLFASIVLPLLTSMTLLAINITGQVSTGRFLSFTAEHRAPTQIIVSMVAGTLASFNVYTVIKLLNLGTRIYSLRHRLSLSMIEFVRAFSTRSVLFDKVATIYSTVKVLTLLLTIPNILWTGALTPVVSNTTRAGTDTLSIPQYSAVTDINWSEKGCNNPTSTVGLVSLCPIGAVKGSLLIQAGRATTNLHSTHPKIDNTQYSYLGRSFGVGSSAGLVDQGLWSKNASSKLISYSYHEPGYDAGVKCIYNASSRFQLSMAYEPTSDQYSQGLPSIHRAGGPFPNATPGEPEDRIFLMGSFMDGGMVAMIARQSHGRNYIMITSGLFYSRIISTQCEVTFTPTWFRVEVNVADRVITVHPSASKDLTSPGSSSSKRSVIFDPTSGLAVTVMNQLDHIGKSSGRNPDFGDALRANIGGSIEQGSNLTSSAILRPMADSIVSMVDDILGSIAGGQSFAQSDPTLSNGLEGDYSQVPVEITVQAVAVGVNEYIFATFGMCILLAIATAIEAIRTRFWRDLPSWDFMQTDCLVYASAVAGRDIVDKMCQLRGGQPPMQWTGTTDCQMMGKFKVQLGKRTVKMIPPERTARTNGDDERGVEPTDTPLSDGSRTRADGNNGRGSEATDTQLTAVSLWTQVSDVESLL